LSQNSFQHWRINSRQQDPKVCSVRHFVNQDTCSFELVRFALTSDKYMTANQ
jgi:hypothetical protein